jgi:hypothetical protein
LNELGTANNDYATFSNPYRARCSSRSRERRYRPDHPQQFLKRIERTGFGEFLFTIGDLTRTAQESPTLFCMIPHANATILVTGKNFGWGSSRDTRGHWRITDST